MIYKNKGIATIAILGIIFGVLVVGGGVYYMGVNKGEDKKVEENNTTDESIVWNKSPQFGLYYKSDYILNKEHYRLMDSVMSIVDEYKDNSVPSFSVIINESKTNINWGGVNSVSNENGNNSFVPAVCDEKTYGAFQYGISDVTCINGYRSWVSNVASDHTITQAELKEFGDFVLKNK